MDTLFGAWLLLCLAVAIACSGYCAPQGATLQHGQPPTPRQNNQAVRNACKGPPIERAKCWERVPY